MKHAWKRFISLWVACLCASTMAHADLKVGVMFFDPPLVMSANQGFHVDLANKICQGLQEKCNSPASLITFNRRICIQMK